MIVTSSLTLSAFRYKSYKKLETTIKDHNSLVLTAIINHSSNTIIHNCEFDLVLLMYNKNNMMNLFESDIILIIIYYFSSGF